MNTVTIASDERDARAAEAVEQHHAQMAGALELKVQTLATAARAGDADRFVAARDDLVEWSRTELVPHAQAEEGTIYRVAAERSEARLLVEAMLAEHVDIIGLVDELARAHDVVAAVGSATALQKVFGIHLAKENDQVLPLLVADPGVSVADLLDGMHDLIGGHDHDHGSAGASAVGCGGHSCTCGEEDEDVPELDARTIPHAIRHATIFGALDTVQPGRSIVLVAPHDPLPLLGQIEARYSGGFTSEYLERGPEAWRLLFVRQPA